MKMSKREQQAFTKAFVTEIGICYREQEILEEAYAFWKSAREFGLSTPNK